MKPLIYISKEEALIAAGIPICTEEVERKYRIKIVEGWKEPTVIRPHEHEEGNFNIVEVGKKWILSSIEAKINFILYTGGWT